MFQLSNQPINFFSPARQPKVNTEQMKDDEILSQGHSESKGAKKREKSAGGGNGNGKPSRGVATSFGFRRRPASTSRADDNSRRKQKAHDKNGNGGEE